MNRIEFIQNIVNTLQFDARVEGRPARLRRRSRHRAIPRQRHGLQPPLGHGRHRPGLGRRICDSLTTGALSETSVRGADGNIYLYATGNKDVLAVIAVAGANVGFIHLEARGAARSLTERL